MPFFVGDIGKVIAVRFLENGTPKDLSAHLELKIHFLKPNGIETEFDAAFDTNGIDGVIKYVTTAVTDLDESGNYSVWGSTNLITRSSKNLFRILPIEFVWYATREDVEFIFGTQNISTWADTNNGESAADIDERIYWAIDLAIATVDARLRPSKYDVPFVSIDQMIIDITARLAGVLLYDSRRITDTSLEVNVDIHRTFVEEMFSQILGDTLILNVVATIDINVPSVVN